MFSSAIGYDSISVYDDLSLSDIPTYNNVNGCSVIKMIPYVFYNYINYNRDVEFTIYLVNSNSE